jgi:hypothetical protein
VRDRQRARSLAGARSLMPDESSEMRRPCEGRDRSIKRCHNA